MSPVAAEQMETGDCTGWPKKVSHYQMIKNSY